METHCENPCTLLDKFAFVNPTDDQFTHLAELLRQRLDDGQGECFLELGVGDGQNPGLSPVDLEHSVHTAERLAKQLDVSLIHLRDRIVHGSGGTPRLDTTANPTRTSSHSPQVADSSQTHPGPTPPRSAQRRQRNSGSQSGPDSPQATKPSDSPGVVMPEPPSGGTSTTHHVAVKEYLLRKAVPSDDFVDVRVAVLGNVDAGKSTLLGVLTHGELDNGRGQARLRLLRHKHEAESGRTSSVSNDILGFDFSGAVVNKPMHGQLDWSTICRASAKVVTFIDLAGHERYLKTTIFGMTGHAPDYTMFMVGANAGVIGMAKEHLGLALALSVPVFVVVTKIDMCPPNVLQETMNVLFRILKSPGCRKMPLLISSKDDVICSATNFSSERICPVFSVSNVTGENLDLLRMFLNLLTPRSQPRLTDPAHFQVDDIFSVPGVGNVVSGTCLAGVIRLNDVLLLGPDPVGQFLPVPIRSIHRKRMPVSHVRGGQTASFALKKLRRNQLHKGIVLVSPELHPRACLEFMADVLILHHPTTISVGYQAMVHAGPVRQTATILALHECDRLRTGDRAMVRFQFIRYPEYLYPGLRLIFREGKTKAVGTVKETFPLTDSIPQVSRGRFAKKYNPQASGPKAQSSASTTPCSAESRPSSSAQPLPDVTSLDLQGPAYSKQRKHYRNPHKTAPKPLSATSTNAPPPPSTSQ